MKRTIIFLFLFTYIQLHYSCLYSTPLHSLFGNYHCYCRLHRQLHSPSFYFLHILPLISLTIPFFTYVCFLPTFSFQYIHDRGVLALHRDSRTQQFHSFGVLLPLTVLVVELHYWSLLFTPLHELHWLLACAWGHCLYYRRRTQVVLGRVFIHVMLLTIDTVY